MITFGWFPEACESAAGSAETANVASTNRARQFAAYSETGKTN